MNHITIFDLDRTVIDSDHRTPYKEGQDLDLTAYRALQTHENIMKDKLLPLAEYMQLLISQGEKVVIVTARRMIKSDYIFLRKNGMKRVYICSRDQLFKRFEATHATRIYNSGDSVYKRYWFEHLALKFRDHSFTVYDDHKGVLQQAQELGFQVYDAIKVNEMLAHFLDLGFEEGFTQGLDQAYIDKSMGTITQVIRYDQDQIAAA